MTTHPSSDSEPESTSSSAERSPDEGVAVVDESFTVDDQGNITSLQGFPNPVRDPDTGMIVPQSRKERRALEEAQERYRAQREDSSVTLSPVDTGQVTVEDVADSEPEQTVAVDTLDHDSEPVTDPEPVDEAPTQAVTVEEPEPEPAKKTSRAGRDLPAAILVGVLLLGSAVVGLLWQPIIVMALIIVLLVLGVWELSQIFRERQLDVPVIPLWFGALAIPLASYFGGIDSMVFALFAAMILALFWITVGDPIKPLPTFVATAFILIWVPFFLSFGVVLLNQPQGASLVAILLLTVVGSDTGGYIAGVLFGKHPMAPKISPKKSWEGFVGSLVLATTFAIVSGLILLHDPQIWYLVLLAVLLVLTATTGDFSASMIKRDLGVKDMGTTLPGHGGVMDRLDSIVFSAPVAFTVFAFVAP